jgi:flagellin
VAAGAQTAVNFTNNGATITANIPSADNLGGSITIGGTISQTGGVSTPLAWAGGASSYTTTVAVGNTLSGQITLGQTGGTGGASLNVTLTGVASTQAAMQTAIRGDITAAGGVGADYNVAYNTGTGAVGITINGTPGDGLSAFTVTQNGSAQTTPIVNPGGTTSPAQVIDLDNVTSANLQNTLNADLAGTDYSATYNSGSGALSFGISGAGTTAGVTALTISGSPTVWKQTPASTSAGATANIPLANVTTANLASTVATALNGVKTTTADYTVGYNSSTGTLTVALTPYATATDNIASLTLSNAATEKTPTAASIAFTDGEQLSGQFTITPTISGVAASGAGITTVNLSGVNTSNLVSTVNAALNATSPGSASDYNVTYNVSQGVGTLSIAVNAVGLAANVDSVTVANGATPATAMGESGVAVTNIDSANTVMGNFTVTPTTAAGAGAGVNVNLQGITNANLQSAVQTALGGNYTVAYNTTANSPNLGNLSISVSSVGAAAGITSFTVAEAASQAASQETPIDGGIDVYTGDGTTNGSQNYNVTVGALSDAGVGTSPLNSVMGVAITATVGNIVGTGGVQAGAGSGTSLVGTDLNTQADAEAALATANNAISGIAFQRGQVGANINTLTAASNIASSQETNVTAAQNTISATDYAAATSNMSKYEILTQTGISALAQANSTQQMVTKLLQ